MSGLLAGKVWHSGLPSLLKPLAACLADEANDRGQGIYPSIAYLAWKLGTSERSVQRGMHELRRLAVLVEVGKKKFGRILLPVYSMDVSKLPYRRPWAESRRGDTSDVSSVRGDTDGGDGVTALTRRGDIAVAPNPLGDPLEGSVSDDFPFSLYEEFKRQFSWLTPTQFRFAVLRIRSRARTPPRSEAFLRKSLAVFLTPTAFSGEIESFLVDEACRLLTDESLSLGGVADELKRAAAGNELPYTAMSIDRAIENARQRTEHRESLTRELRIGEFTPREVVTD